MRSWGAAWLMIASSALAAPRTVAVAAGDCQSAELVAAARAFSAALPPESMSGESVLERFRPVATASGEELGQKLEAAQAQFYAGQHEKALETARLAISGIERLPPRAEPWKLLSRALMLEGLIFKSLGKKTEASDAHRRVLRIEPDFKLDADYYTPVTLQAFEVLRKELQKAKRARLTITSSPSGAEVFVDGALAGKTPFARDFPLSDYRLELASGERRSFTRELKLTRDEALQVDLGFEGALNAQAPLCVSAPGPQSVETALKLAALAGAEEVVVLRVDEPGRLIGALLEVNKGLTVRQSEAPATGPLTALATFLLTGKQPVGVAAAPLPPKPEAPVAAKPEPEPVPAAAVEPPPVVEVRHPRGSGPRIASFVLMGAGVVSAASGLGVYLSDSADRTALGALLDANGQVKDSARADEVKQLQARVDGHNLPSLVLGAAGLALIAAGVAVFFLFPPEDAPAVSLVPLRDGVFARASFSF